LNVAPIDKAFQEHTCLALITYLNDNRIKYEELPREIVSVKQKVAEQEAIFTCPVVFGV
jgi:hypothetical protein